MLEYYYAPGSSSMAPHIALHETGASFEPRLISFAKAEQKTPEYLAINPEGKVPTLVIDGRPLTEVAAILFYLASIYPDAGLFPEGVEDQARVISWMSFTASNLHGARRRGLDYATGLYRIADARLGERDWLVGGRYSIADIHLFRLYWRMINQLHPPAGAFPNLQRHHDRMMQRTAVRKTLEIEAAGGYEFPEDARR